MRTNRRATLVAVFVAILLACQTAPGPTTPAATIAEGAATDAVDATPGTEVATTTVAAAPSATPVSEEGELSWVFDAPFDPIKLEVEVENENTVGALVPRDGGSLSVTGADGTVYTLDVPVNALLTSTTISMTPVSSLTGMPFGGEQTYAVEFAPDGLYFYESAILTIQPAQAIPVNQQLYFGYEADGPGLTLAAPVANPNGIQIRVDHFSVNGVTKGLVADLEPVRQRLGGDIEDRLKSALSEELTRLQQEDASGDVTSAAIEAALDEYEQEVVKPRVAAAGESCAAGQLAVQSVNTLARSRQLAGIEAENPLVEYPELLSLATETCLREEYALCVEQHIIHRMVTLYYLFNRQFALMGAEDAAVLELARELARKCLTFQLKFESTGSLSANGAGWESTVFSDITLRLDADLQMISGEAPLVNTKFTLKFPGDCAATEKTGDGLFRAFRLVPLDGAGAPPNFYSPDAELGHVYDLVLQYMPGDTAESATMVCGGIKAPNYGPTNAWTAMFMVTHGDGLETDPPDILKPKIVEQLDQVPIEGTGFVMRQWEILGGEYFAKREWILEVKEVVEVGAFKLYHRPGP